MGLRKAGSAVLSSTLLLFALSPGMTQAQAAQTSAGVIGGAKPAAAAPEREFIPGAERMSSAERDAYRQRMAAAATAEEQAGICAEYIKAAAAAAPARSLVGDPIRGAALHSACFSCHGVERYVAPVTYAAASFIDSVLRASGLSDLPPAEPARFKGSIKSLPALRDHVSRRNEYLNPKMTPQEVEDLVAYLNLTYYKFPQ